MDLAGSTYPAAYAHADLPGISLLPAVEGGKSVPRTLFFEHQSSCAIIDGQWKLVRYNRNTPWELIDLSRDPFETADLSREYPEKAARLQAEWEEWAKTHHVLPLENKPWGKRIQYYKEKNPDQDGVD